VRWWKREYDKVDGFDVVGALSSELFPFQLKAMEGGPIAIVVKSRQIGLSLSTAVLAVDWAVRGETTTVVSVGEREAHEFVLKAEKVVDVLSETGLFQGACHRKDGALIFPTGGRIIPLPSTSGGRSYSGNVILDEFAYHRDQEAVWDAAAAVTLHRDCQLRVLSTPNGEGDLFESLVKNEEYHQHKIMIHQAIKEGMAVSLEKCWKLAHHDPSVFAQLFECSFLKGDTQYFPSELVDACLCPYLLGTGDITLGIDIGLTRHLTAIAVLKRTPTGHFLQDMIERQNLPWEEQRALIGETIRQYSPRRVGVDATGIGKVPVQELQSDFGKVIVPFDFSLRVKEELMTGLYSKMATGKVKILRTLDPTVKAMKSVRRYVTKERHHKYESPSTRLGHADQSWALAMASAVSSDRVYKDPFLDKTAEPGTGSFDFDMED
jgi:phage FluMu gp28-like protein